ncbi:toxin co-regulated pilus biosynthesis Q family protein [Pusillimonas caeni]|uniref:toxin co-regulated pilus biosynthesis Q family protein n=1 Tax=Pusillimonas caeni TaxID=1348472 RepID=UPI001ADDD7EF|nr:toxin co-regulated pilus biosynthesis Q family protein [Pusillimonas caeni]
MPLSELDNHPTQLVEDTVAAPIAVEEEKTTSRVLARKQPTNSDRSTVQTGNEQAATFFWPITLPYQMGTSIAITSDKYRWHFHWPPIDEADAIQHKITSADEAFAVLPGSEEALTFAVPDSFVQMGDEFDVTAPLLSAADMMAPSQSEPKASNEPSPVAPNDTPSPNSTLGTLQPAQGPGRESTVEVALHSEEMTEATLRTWAATKGSALSDLLREWAAREDWTIRWDAKLDFVIEAPFSIEASDFLAAAERILTAYRRAGYEFYAVAYSNKVLLIKNTKD